jgi:hypothetical protein
LALVYSPLPHAGSLLLAACAAAATPAASHPSRRRHCHVVSRGRAPVPGLHPWSSNPPPSYVRRCFGVHSAADGTLSAGGTARYRGQHHRSPWDPFVHLRMAEGDGHAPASGLRTGTFQRVANRVRLRTCRPFTVAGALASI